MSKKDVLEKSNEMVVNSNSIGVKPIEMAAQHDALDHLPSFYSKLKEILESMSDFAISDVMIDLQDGNPFWAEFSKQGPNIFSCVLRCDGQMIQEIKNQTCEIISTMLAAQIGSDDALIDLISSDVWENKEAQEAAIAIPEIASIPEQPPLPKKFSVEIQDHQIAIYIEKSQGKNMADQKKPFPPKKPTDDKQKPVDQGQGQNPAAQAKPQASEATQEKDPSEQAEQTDPNLQKEQDPFAQQEEQPEQEQTQDPNVDITGTQASAEGNMDQNNEVEEGMGENINEEDVDADGNPIEANAEQEDGQGEDGKSGLVFIKTSVFSGGVQHWYRDQATGKVVEGAEPPPGSDTINQAMSAVMGKLAELNAKLDGMGGAAQQPGMPGQQAPLAAGGASAPGAQLMNDEDATDPLQQDMGSDDPSVPGQDNDGVTPDDFDKMVDEEIGQDDMSQEGSEADQVDPADPNEQAAGTPAPAPAPEAKDKKPMDKKAQLKKSLEIVKTKILERQPDISEDNLKKSLVKACGMMMKKLDESEQAQAAKIADAEVKDHEKDMHKKKGLKKSRLQRIWSVSGIEMPDSIDSKESIAKAQEGIAKAQKFVMNQGKSEQEANRVINRAVIEKYDLMNKGSKFFANKDDFMGKVTVADGKEKTNEVLKSDSDRRFAVKEYVEPEGSMTIAKSGDKTAKAVEALIKGQTADFNEFKNFEEKFTKSQPTQAEVEQDKYWSSVPSFNEEKTIQKSLVVETKSDVADKVKKSLEAPKDVSFDKVKAFNEDEVKKARTEKTDQEIFDELQNKKWEALNGNSK